MNYMRAYKGQGKGQEVHNVEEGSPSGYNGQEAANPPQNPGNNLNSLESKGGWRRVLSNIETKNRYSALEVKEEENQEATNKMKHIPAPPGLE